MSTVPRKYDIGGERLTIKELSRRTGISKSTLTNRVKSGKRDDSLWKPVDKSEAGRIAAFCRYDQSHPSIADADDDVNMSYEEIAEKLGISTASVRRIERLALTKIRRQLSLS